MSSTLSPPSISIHLSISPPLFTPGSEPRPQISITATSHAPSPITIFTWPTIFNLRLAQRRKNFSCLDLTTSTPVRMERTKGPKRTAFTRASGSPDEAYFVTLEPGIPAVFSYPFTLASIGEDGDGVSWRTQPGHRYRLWVSEGEEVRWWWVGRKEEVMREPGMAGMGEPDGGPIGLEVAPVEFEVESGRE